MNVSQARIDHWRAQLLPAAREALACMLRANPDDAALAAFARLLQQTGEPDSASPALIQSDKLSLTLHGLGQNAPLLEMQLRFALPQGPELARYTYVADLKLQFVDEWFVLR